MFSANVEVEAASYTFFLMSFPIPLSKAAINNTLQYCCDLLMKVILNYNIFNTGEDGEVYIIIPLKKKGIIKL